MNLMSNLYSNSMNSNNTNNNININYNNIKLKGTHF